MLDIVPAHVYGTQQRLPHKRLYRLGISFACFILGTVQAYVLHVACTEAQTSGYVCMLRCVGFLIILSGPSLRKGFLLILKTEFNQ